MNDPEEVARVRARIGRPPTYAPLLGLDAAALARVVAPHRPSPTNARRWLAGRADMGTVHLHRLILWAASTGRPESCAEVVAEVAARLAASARPRA